MNWIETILISGAGRIGNEGVDVFPSISIVKSDWLDFCISPVINHVCYCGKMPGCDYFSIVGICGIIIVGICCMIVDGICCVITRCAGDGF